MKKLTIVLLSCLLSGSLIAQNFEEITGTPFEGVYSSSIAFADIDNDGDQDVLITGANGDEAIAILYTNDGNGNYEEDTGTPFEGVSSSSIAFADVDNDGDQDVLITGEYYTDENRIFIAQLYKNNGLGNFTEVLDTPFQGVFNGSIAFADIDDDNDLDVLITGNPPWFKEHCCFVGLYTNSGNGNFTAVEDSILRGVGDSFIAFADIDNDNDQDVLITGDLGFRSPPYSAKLYSNDGNGSFELDTVSTFQEVRDGSIAFADIDNDNDLDVLITGRGNSNERITKLYINNGSGFFSEVEGTPFEGVQHSSIAFADIDNDNDQDVLITGAKGNSPYYNQITKLYSNDGNGNFLEVLDTPFDGVFVSSIAFADIENDGDQDVLITGYNGDERISKLYRNLTIQVGINEKALFSSVSIYPNPNTGLINIDLGSLTDVAIKVFSVSGLFIYYKEHINTLIHKFELDAAPGVYILELSAAGEKQQFKLVKQ